MILYIIKKMIRRKFSTDYKTTPFMVYQMYILRKNGQVRLKNLLRFVCFLSK